MKDKKEPTLSVVKDVERPIKNNAPPEIVFYGSPAPIELNEEKIDQALEIFYAKRDIARDEYERQQSEDIADLVRSLNEARNYYE